jgi:hypothetical protein
MLLRIAMTRAAAVLLIVSLAAPMPAFAGENVDLEMITRIREEGFRRSKVMETMSELTDRIGPRLTGSPNIKRAHEWTRDTLKAWGLENAHLDQWGPFGRGWSLEFAAVRMVAPDVAMMYAIPKAWTPGTNGVVRAKAVKTKLTTREDLAANKGKLRGLIVLNGDMREVKPQEKAALERLDDAKLADIARYQIPGERGQFDREAAARRRGFQQELLKFLEEEGVAAMIEPSRGDGGTIFVQGGGSYRKGESVGVPNLVMAIEHYGRIWRLLDRKVDVELEVDVRTKFHDNDPMGYNTIAEIPGSDKKDEVVMLGAHMDSWHGGTGATDNGSGVAVTMEAVRILQALGVKPRRTIRIGLWGGEEQGLLGSRAYAAKNFGMRAVSNDQRQQQLPEFLRTATGPLTIQPAQQKVAAYFNIDNGTGKVRGVYLQENAAVRPIFEQWIEPFKDLGVTTVAYRNTGGTDHLSFDAVGIPGFQFIQDPVEYDTRTHHSNMDVYERLQRDDLMQASVVLAAFVYHAAMRDQMLPRKRLPADTLFAQESKPEPAKAADKKKKPAKAAPAASAATVKSGGN